MVQSAWDAKAEDPVILDLRGLSFSFSYFFICTAASSRRIQAVVDHIVDDLRDDRVKPQHVEGKPTPSSEVELPEEIGKGDWVLIDYGAVVAHVFSEAARDFYGLEKLWSDAPRIEVPEPLPVETKKAKES